MKNIIFVLLIALVSVSTYAQEKNKNAKHVIIVNGNCEICKKKIEKAAYSVPGVKSAIWQPEDKTLRLIMNEQKATEKDVEIAVAKVGYDTKDVKARDEVYNKLHHCCMYERENILHSKIRTLN